MATSHERVKLAQDIVKRTTQRLSGARKEAEHRAQADLDRRKAATTILNPDEVSGLYDAGRLLTTSLRGDVRAITQADLRAFQQNVSNFKKLHQTKKRGKPAQFVGGITAQHVIDLALWIDKKRANEEIRTSVPVGVKANVLHFVTNAGPDSDKMRHHVHVEFIDFEQAVGASSLDARKTGKQIANGRLKFDCDCGRHTFWYRYMATIGEYNYGRSETGFPKLKNPKLVGVACKHVLRTMHNIQKDAAIHKRLYQQVLKQRETLDRNAAKYEKVKVAEVRAHGEKQAARGRSANLRMGQSKEYAAAQLKKAAQTMARRAADKARRDLSPDQRRAQADARKALAGLQQALKFGGITQAQYDALAANLGVKTK
jgi:hypothetical protein